MANLDPIRALIADGKIKEALSGLLQSVERSDRSTRKMRDGIIILQSKFQDLSRKETLGLIDTEAALREKAQINDALLNLMSDIESHTVPVEEVSSVQSVKKWWWLLLLLIPVGGVVVFWGDLKNGLTSSQKGSTTNTTVPGTVLRRASISFEESLFDFGTVFEGNTVTHTFGFQNTGDAALVISEVVGSSGYVIQHWHRDSILPGGHGEITVAFNTQGKTGAQRGQITVRGNTSPPQTILTMRGMVQGVTANTLKPIARFQIENNDCEAPCNLKLVNSSDNAVSYKWEFGDGQTDVTRSPTHRYTDPGVYTVALRATSAGGISDFTRQTATINAAKQAKIEFGETEFNFGNIAQGTFPKHAFNFRNTGSAYLNLMELTCQPGCTITSRPDVPIPPNGQGKIVVEFSAIGQNGPQQSRIKVVANTVPKETILTVKGNVQPPPEGGGNTASWGWKRVTQANIEDANNFLNGIGAYTRKVRRAEITPAVGSNSDFIVFYQVGVSSGWGWKRVTNLNLEDAHNFLNGTGAYSQKIKSVEIFPVQRGSQKDLILFYQTGISSDWGWKRVTSLDLTDALHFLNGSGAYNQTIKNLEIVAVQEGSRTDLIVFYQTGQTAVPGQWKHVSISDNNALQTFLGTTKEAEVVTVGSQYIVFYKK